MRPPVVAHHNGSAGAMFETVIAAAHSRAPIAGLTHNFYRYPARFSPALANALITTFTKQGDLVVDPFMGGGTTLVEAIALGRKAIGSDISSLATFVSEVKTTVFTKKELVTLREWAGLLDYCIDLRLPAKTDTFYETAGYLRNINDSSTWRLRKALAQVLQSASSLIEPRLENFARCVALRTGQWALDGRRSLPDLHSFRTKLVLFAHEMIERAEQLAEVAGSFSGARASCLRQSSVELQNHPALLHQAPRLICTSPPYPGVHVLYHRWQVHGGRETPAPFWIANQLDGDGAAYYTMGARNSQDLKKYFDDLSAAMHSIAAISDEETTLVQIVAFSEPGWQLPRYLSVVDDAGFDEFFLPHPSGEHERLWRSVPNRKWYATQKGRTNGSEEVVLFHKLRSSL